MLTITTNIQSFISQRSLSKSTQLLNQAIERMSTGYKLNHASDNAANYSISTNLTTKLGAYQVAEDNAAMGLDMLTTANESLNLISEHLTRIRALKEQAANGTYGAQSLDAINSEVNARVDEIERLYSTAEYNGINLFKGENVGETKFLQDIVRRDTSKMTTLSSVDETQKLKKDTYSISTPEELAKLATMTNSGLLEEGSEFVLADNIDLSGYSNWTSIGVWNHHFIGTFDGNGYEISNLTANSTIDYVGGLFRGIQDAEILNLGLVNVNISGTRGVGALVAIVEGNASNIVNCYTSGTIQTKGDAAGFLGGVWSKNINIDSCYSEATALSDGFAAGFIASCGHTVNINNSYFLGESRAGFVGYADYETSDINITNSACYGILDADYGAVFLAKPNPKAQLSISDCKYIGDNVICPSSLTPKLSNVEKVSQPEPLSKGSLYKGTSSDIQVGVNASSSSQIVVNTSFVLPSLDNLSLSKIDSLLETISAKQTEYGAAQNRLESALDEISMQYENILSSRSTLKDADIAKVSSQYIQQQILQQASATLMSTANQTPALALQLL